MSDSALQAPEHAAIELRGVTKRFAGIAALEGVDLLLHAGEVHALAGENGAGKSSLIKVMCGAYSLDGGSMVLRGNAFAPRSPLDAIRAGIRVVHQELHMLEQLSVAENLLFERLPRNRLGMLDRASMQRRAQELLALVGLEGVSPSAPVAGLGMAQRQLIEIAKALSSDSRIVVMDEPTATLTSRETVRLFEIIGRLRTAGVAVLFVSHHLQELFEIADRVTVLRNGRKVATQTMTETTPRDLVRLMVGRDVTQRAAGGTPATTGTTSALQVSGLRYRGQPGSRGLDFGVGYGEIVGLAGLVGSGRTETVRAIFGADRAVAGTVQRDGVEVTIRTPRDALRHGICLVTEDRKDEGLVLDMPVRTNITLASLAGFARAGWLHRGAERRVAEQMVDKLDIRLANVEQPPRELSGGNQQKVVLAKWLVRRPAVLILDEPTRGVDVGAKAEIHALLQGMAAEGIAILVVSSDLPELMQVCDRIMVMSRGTLAGELTRDEFDEQALLVLAYREYLKTESDLAHAA